METDEDKIKLQEGCRSDICTDYGEDCCAPVDEPRGCSLEGFTVQAGGTSSYAACESTYGTSAIYQCCVEDSSPPPPLPPSPLCEDSPEKGTEWCAKKAKNAKKLSKLCSSGKAKKCEATCGC